MNINERIRDTISLSEKLDVDNDKNLKKVMNIRDVLVRWQGELDKIDTRKPSFITKTDVKSVDKSFNDLIKKLDKIITR